MQSQSCNAFAFWISDIELSVTFNTTFFAYSNVYVLKKPTFSAPDKFCIIKLDNDLFIKGYISFGGITITWVLLIYCRLLQLLNAVYLTDAVNGILTLIRLVQPSNAESLTSTVPLISIVESLEHPLKAFIWIIFTFSGIVI